MSRILNKAELDRLERQGTRVQRKPKPEPKMPPEAPREKKTSVELIHNADAIGREVAQALRVLDKKRTAWRMKIHREPDGDLTVDLYPIDMETVR